jgi:hypothetical protein
MPRPIAKHSAPDIHRIEIKLRDLNQLFNTMDPSPFHEKDLDEDAEEFIVSWAREFPLREPVVLAIYLTCPEAQLAQQQPDSEIEKAIHHYFQYRADIVHMEFRRLMREGRLSLIIGLVFLTACLTTAQLFSQHAPEPVGEVVREGLTIFGWVAMWQPAQIYLYGWWPLKRRRSILQKLAAVKIEIVRE